MPVTVVTSFREEDWYYAKDCIESFKKFWPSDVKLVVYYEGTHLRDDWKPISEIEHLDNWMRAIAPFQLMSGKLQGEYDINFDARMCRKVFIQLHAAKEFGGKVFWMDADVITHEKVTHKFLDEVLPDDKLCCYLGRDWNNGHRHAHTESGFIGFNTQHPQCDGFLAFYRDVVMSGYIFAQPGWHDCFAFDIARKHVIQAKPSAKGWFLDHAAHLRAGVMHPFINSILGSCLDHRKGNRKTTRSPLSDLVKPRKEAYWNVSQDAPLKKSTLAMSIATALQQAS
jgi:hypothetical protein